MATLVKISINDDVARVLERLKGEYPTLDAPELFKLGLAELDRKREVEARRRWTESLPTLQISAEEAASIAEARQEPSSGPYTAEELLKKLKSSADD